MTSVLNCSVVKDALKEFDGLTIDMPTIIE